MMKFVLQDSPVNWEPLLSRAQPRFGIDTVDRVKVNHLGFGEALAPIARIAAKGNG